MRIYCSKSSINFHYCGVGVIVHVGEFLRFSGERLIMGFLSDGSRFWFICICSTLVSFKRKDCYC